MKLFATLLAFLLLALFLLLFVSAAEVGEAPAEPSALVSAKPATAVVDSNEVEVADWSGETSVNVSGRRNEESKAQGEGKSAPEKISSDQASAPKEQNQPPCQVERKVAECQAAKAVSCVDEEKSVASSKVQSEDKGKASPQKKEKSKKKRSVEAEAETQAVEGKKQDKKGRSSDSPAKSQEKGKPSQGKVAKPKSGEEKPNKSTKSTKSKNAKGKNGKKSKKNGKSSSASRSKSQSKDRKKRSNKSESKK